jgi:hypothetical protein
MQPAEAWGVLAAKEGLMGFAVVFEGPHGIPEIGTIGGNNTGFACGDEDLVLAEAPGGNFTRGAHGLAMDAGALGLGAGFDQGYAVGVDQLVDRGHVGALGANPSAGSDLPEESSKAANRVSP